MFMIRQINSIKNSGTINLVKTLKSVGSLLHTHLFQKTNHTIEETNKNTETISKPIKS